MKIVNIIAEPTDKVAELMTQDEIMDFGNSVLADLQSVYEPGVYSINNMVGCQELGDGIVLVCSKDMRIKRLLVIKDNNVFATLLLKHFEYEPVRLIIAGIVLLDNFVCLDNTDDFTKSEPVKVCITPFTALRMTSLTDPMSGVYDNSVKYITSKFPTADIEFFVNNQRSDFLSIKFTGIEFKDSVSTEIVWIEEINVYRDGQLLESFLLDPADQCDDVLKQCVNDSLRILRNPNAVPKNNDEACPLCTAMSRC
jgi:hypothetical protein